jgi:hypothetical protein
MLDYAKCGEWSHVLSMVMLPPHSYALVRKWDEFRCAQWGTALGSGRNARHNAKIAWDG